MDSVHRAILKESWYGFLKDEKFVYGRGNQRLPELFKWTMTQPGKINVLLANLNIRNKN